MANPQQVKRRASRGQVQDVVRTAKLSVVAQKRLIPDDSVRAAFMRRSDIVKLNKQSRDAMWQKHLIGLNQFREWLTNIPAVVLPS